MVRHVNYDITRGVPFERLLIVKNRRNRRMIKPTQARASLRTEDGFIVPMQATITREWGIRLYMSAEETQDLPLGASEWDALAHLTAYSVQSPFYLSSSYNDSPYSPLPEAHWRPIAKGLITVKDFDTITSAGGATTMRLMYKQRTDLRRRFHWYASGSTTPIEVDDAYLVAVDAANAVVLALRWFPTVPDETTIAALPAGERGYLAPSPEASLEMHLSDKLDVAPGEYRFALMVQAAGDWEELAAGTIVVEFSPASLRVTTP